MIGRCEIYGRSADLDRRTVRKLIQARSQNKTSSKADMADAFMKHGLSENDCVTEATLQIVAGADAVATVLRCTMLLLISNPGAYRKLQEEVDAEVRRSCEVGSVVKSADAAALPYLQAVIKEGTRTFPPATDFATKQVPPEGDVIEIEGQSVTLPGGARVTNAAWSMMHRKDIFGDDAEAFRPERWLEAEGNKLTRMNKTVDLIFGYGKYQCLGMSLATIEINKALFEVSRLTLRVSLVIEADAENS